MTASDGMARDTHREERRLVGLSLDCEQSVDDEPVENSLDPSIILGDRTIADECCELVDDPPSAGVERLYVGPKRTSG